MVQQLSRCPLPCSWIRMHQPEVESVSYQDLASWYLSHASIMTAHLNV